MARGANGLLNASVSLFNTIGPAHQVAYGLRGLEPADSQQ